GSVRRARDRAPVPREALAFRGDPGAETLRGCAVRCRGGGGVHPVAERRGVRGSRAGPTPWHRGAPMTQPLQELTSPWSAERPPRILIVDDEPSVRGVIRRALANADYRVEEAA